MTKWPVVALAEVFDVARGGSPRPIDAYITESQDGINWIMISDASEGSKYITRTKKRIRPEGAQRSRTVQPGEFLLTNSMSFGKPYILNTSGCIHDGWLVLSPRRRDVDSDFFYHLLGSRTLYNEFERRASGATVKNLNIDMVKGIAVPLPPLVEQRRIAEILDKADALRAKRRAALAQLDTLTQSIFLHMFGDWRSNRDRWPVAVIEDVCELVVDCVNRTAPTVEGPTPFKMIRTSNVKAGRVLLDDVRYVTEDVFERWNRRATPRRGDVILTREAPVGEAALIETDHQLFLGQRLMLYRTNKTMMTPEFLLASFRSDFLQRQFHVHGSGSTVKHLPLPACRGFRVQVPPIELQRDFTRCVIAARKLTAMVQMSEQYAETLFASLQHRAFRGEL